MGTVRDRNVGWLRKRVFYPFQTHNAYVLTAGTPNTVTSLGAGTRAWTQRTGLNMTGLLLTTAADGVEFDQMMPYDMDLSKPVGVRVLWTSNAAAVGARTITWAVTYGTNAAGTAVVSGATALDTVIPAQAPTGTNNAIERGTRGLISAATAATIATTSFWWSWKVLMSAFNAAFTENKYYLGLEIDYMPRRTYGYGTILDAPVLTNPMQLQVPPNI